MIFVISPRAPTLAASRFSITDRFRSLSFNTEVQPQSFDHRGSITEENYKGSMTGVRSQRFDHKGSIAEVLSRKFDHRG